MRAAYFLALIFFTASFAIRTDFSFDQDLGRHIKLGEIIVSSGQVPKTNLFSYTNPDFPFINHHFFFEVLTFWGDKIVGVEAMLWIKVLLILSAVGLILSILTKSYYLLALPISYIFLHVLRGRVDLRPEIFSFLFAASTLVILERFAKNKSKLIYLLPLIQLIWVNTHIYFLVGLFLQAIFILNLKNKRLISVFVLSVIVGVINPNGLSGFLYPLQVFGNYGYTIAENQTIFLLESLNFRDPDFLFAKLSALLVITSIIIGAVRKTLSVKNFLLATLGLTLAMMNVRSFPYLIFISLPAVIENFGPVKKTVPVLAILGITGFLLLYESFIYLSGDYYKYSDKNTWPQVGAKAQAEKAMDFVLQNDLPQPIFNNFDIGSYIIYRGYPKYRVFVDGRPEAYPAKFFQNLYIPIQETPQNFAEADKKFNFQTIIFSHTDQTPWAKNFFSFIVKDQNWKVVYLDDFMIVLTKKQNDLQPVNLDKLSPDQYNFDNHLSYLRLGAFLLNNNNRNMANLFFQKSLQLFPESPILNSKNTIWW